MSVMLILIRTTLKTSIDKYYDEKDIIDSGI